MSELNIRACRVRMLTKTAIDGEIDEIVTAGRGTYCFDESAPWVQFDTIENGEDIVSTRVGISGKSCTIERNGAVRSVMHIEKGVRRQMPYSTAVGTLTLEVEGRTLRTDLGESGGSIDLRYILHMGSDKTLLHVVITIECI